MRGPLFVNGLLGPEETAEAQESLVAGGVPVACGPGLAPQEPADPPFREYFRRLLAPSFATERRTRSPLWGTRDGPGVRRMRPAALG